MKKTTQKIYLTILLTTVLIIPSLAQDNPPPGQEAADDDIRREAASGRLNLSAEQKEEIQALRQSQKQQTRELHQSLKQAREKLREQLDNPEATRESIAPLAAEVKALLANMVDQRVAAILAVKEILTPEQFGQLQRGRQKMRDNMRDRRQFRFGARRTGRGEQTTQQEDNKDE